MEENCELTSRLVLFDQGYPLVLLYILSSLLLFAHVPESAAKTTLYLGYDHPTLRGGGGSGRVPTFRNRRSSRLEQLIYTEIK